MNKIVVICTILLAFFIGMIFDAWYYNLDGLYKANEFKREYIKYSDNAWIVIDSIIESHADDGVCDQLIDELNETDYFINKDKVDSLAATQL